ncbi:MAG: hypothetical protein KBC96_01550 [Armatimonadetes bacterium]|nr:hypothetical protein [Armatimonadota bacterium]
MSPMTIAGTPVDIRLSKTPEGGWIARGRIYDGVLPGDEQVDVTGASRREAESQCRERLERLIHALEHGTE